MSICSKHHEAQRAYLSRPVPTPDVCMRDKSEQAVRPSQFRASRQVFDREDGQPVNNASQPAAQYQPLEVLSNRLPLGVIPVRKYLKRCLRREEAIIWRDIVVN